MYSLAGRETTGKGSAIISDITTFPVVAHMGVKPMLIFCEQFPDISHKSATIRLSVVLFSKSFWKTILYFRSPVFSTDDTLFSLIFNEKFSGAMIPLPGSSLSVISTEFLPEGSTPVIMGASLSS